MNPITIGGYSGAFMVLTGFACRSRMTPVQYSLINCPVLYCSPCTPPST